MHDPLWHTLAALFHGWTGMLVPDTMRATAVYELTRMAAQRGREPLALLAALDGDAEARQELLDRIGLGTTWFAREQSGIAALVAKLAPMAQRRRPLRVWSAGCSSGEEPYTLAMSFADAGVDARILATDLNRRALRHARDARYSRRAIARLPDAWQTRYFDYLDDETARVIEALRERVSFARHNLRSDETLPPGWRELDAVVCRNVLIYFQRYEAVEMVHKLVAHCRVGGYLLLSAVEQPLFWMSELAPQRETDQLMQVSPGPVSVGASLHGALSPARIQEPPKLPQARVLSPRARGVRRQRAPAAASPPASTRASASGNADPGSGRDAATQPATPSDAPREDAAQSPEVADLLQRACELEKLGQLDEALQRLTAAANRAPLAAAVHLERGLLLKRLTRLDEAVHALRAARFLDADSWLAPYQLAMCLEARGELKEAEEGYRHALAVIDAGGGPGPSRSAQALAHLATTAAEVCRQRVGKRAHGNE
ncbi:CheR family methyltransferase [Haliangium ochraceum]|uniref:MCP methyltransferase, CheR-type n=1 Tax=Haliangium ochraceum (strain DSM 14365 / JCM 11303 / SMP-2) TaxID=502025 RepID=D0LUD0_HALO1|nr:CheR family methyltransferase [Haliangium ochraceum]ACY19253.1 MCP methyltransferase, CheR-type [Haliangium ochraceum DSM 14365]